MKKLLLIVLLIVGCDKVTTIKIWYSKTL